MPEGRSPAPDRGAPAEKAPAANRGAPTLRCELLHGAAELRLNREARASVRCLAGCGPVVDYLARARIARRPLGYG
eukprot:9136415-Alexandrium_andersonii.AAC.1